MNKRLLGVFFVIITILCCSFFLSCSEPMGGESNSESESESKTEILDNDLSDYYYEMNTDNTCTITGVKDKSIEEVHIPACVTKIKGSAFEGCANIKGVYTPSLEAWCNIDFIKDEKYYSYPYLYHYQSNPFVANFLCHIGIEEFIPVDFYVNGVLTTDIVIPNTVDEIKSFAFSFSNITSLKTSNSVTSIGFGAFVSCNNLLSVEIGDGVTTIRTGAFSSCQSLTSVVIGANLMEIELAAFSGCSLLNAVYYKGNAEGWNGISIDNLEDGNIELINATKYYYCDSQTEVPTDGNYWFYNEDGEIEVL